MSRAAAALLHAHLLGLVGGFAPDISTVPTLSGDVKLNFLSATLGDHMVLQGAPQSAVVWGHTTPAATVRTVFAGQTYTATAGPDGMWRQRLPPTAASMQAYTLTFNSSAGETAQLADVLFGDVYICGGQSNMEFTVPQVENATAEIALADKYPHIRLFTVGQGTRADTALADLQTVQQPWSVASSTSIAFSGGFSAVCWFFARRISDSLPEGERVPLGLVSNNWGGTRIEEWSTDGVLKVCKQTGSNGTLYNAMISPYTIGPMAVTGFTWYQGEANTVDDASAQQYACLFPSLISSWRQLFNNAQAYFGFVQLSTWCDAPEGIAAMREAQMSGLTLPLVGYATNADHGAGCDIHPTAKQYCGQRLGDSALALQYKKPVTWQSPTYQSAKVLAANSEGVRVLVTLNGVSKGGVTTDTYPFNYVPNLNCTDLDAKTPGTCAWASIEIDGVGWVNATLSAAPAGSGRLILEASASTVPAGLRSKLAGASVLATSYGWGAIPMMSVYDAGTGLPALPWKRAMPSARARELLLVV